MRRPSSPARRWSGRNTISITRGNLTLCCQLSGYAGGTPGTDVVGNLHELSLAEAVDRFHQRVAMYLADKRTGSAVASSSELDHFPCWYCVKYLNKVPGLTRLRHHPWAHAPAATWEERAMVTWDHQVRPHPEVVDTVLDTGETVLLQLEAKPTIASMAPARRSGRA